MGCTVPICVARTLARSSSVFETLLEMRDQTSEEEDELEVPSSCPHPESVAQLVAYVECGTAPTGHPTLSAIEYDIRAWDAMAMFMDVPIVYPGSTTLSFMDALTGFPALKRSVELNVFRRRHVFKIRGALDCTPFAFLRPVSELMFETDAAEAPNPAARVASLRLAPDPRPSRSAADMVEGFARTVGWFTSTFRPLPWYDGKSGIVLAGGFLTASLYGKSKPGDLLADADVDMFIVVNHMDFPAPALAQAEAHRIFQAVFRALRKDEDKVFVSAFKKHAVNFTVLSPFYLKLQLILAIYDTPTHVVHGFDIPLCKVLYTPLHGGMLTVDALRAIRTNEVLYDETTMSASGVHRYIKYMERYGVAVLVPGISQKYLDLLFVRLYWSHSTRTVTKDVGKDHDAQSGTLIAIVSQCLHYLNNPRRSQVAAMRSRSTSDYEHDDVEILAQTSRSHLKRRMHSFVFPVVSTLNPVFTGAFNPVRTNIYRDLPLDLLSRSKLYPPVGLGLSSESTLPLRSAATRKLLPRPHMLFYALYVLFRSTFSVSYVLSTAYCDISHRTFVRAHSV